MVFFFPKTIETIESEINGKITVTKLFGSYTIQAGGFTQSGGLVRAIWRNALKSLKNEGLNPEDVLILGLGAGSAAREVNQHWPNARTIGVELDPVMIELGKKYFGLNRIPRLTIARGDAVHWVLHRQTGWKERFDLILLDLYLGGNVPTASRQETFLKAMGNLLTNQGVVLVNHLIKKGEKDQKQISQKLSAVFTHVERIPTPANAVFAAWITNHK